MPRPRKFCENDVTTKLSCHGASKKGLFSEVSPRPPSLSSFFPGIIPLLGARGQECSLSLAQYRAGEDVTYKPVTSARDGPVNGKGEGKSFTSIAFGVRPLQKCIRATMR